MFILFIWQALPGVTAEQKNEGMQLIVKKAEELDDGLFKTGLYLIIDGVDSKIMKEILDNIILTSFKTGAELLSQFIIRDGLIALQLGRNPRLIEEKLLAWLGEEFTKKLK